MTGAPYLPGFGRCGIPRLSTGHTLLATGLDVDGHLHLAHSGAEVRGIPHLPKPGRYGAPVIRYGTGREKCGLVARRTSPTLVESLFQIIKTAPSRGRPE